MKFVVTVIATTRLVGCYNQVGRNIYQLFHVCKYWQIGKGFCFECKFWPFLKKTQTWVFVLCNLQIFVAGKIVYYLFFYILQHIEYFNPSLGQKSKLVLFFFYSTVCYWYGHVKILYRILWIDETIFSVSSYLSVNFQYGLNRLLQPT